MKSFDQQVRDWAANKPADVEYNYMDNHNCALCQFLKEQGYEDDPEVGGITWGRRGVLGGQRLSGTLEQALVRLPNTFGALAERLS